MPSWDTLPDNARRHIWRWRTRVAALDYLRRTTHPGLDFGLDPQRMERDTLCDDHHFDALVRDAVFCNAAWHSFYKG